MDQVDDQSLNVRPIVVLIRHDHEMSVPESLDVVCGIQSTHLQPKDLDDALHFFIRHDLLVVGIADVEWLSFERIHTVEVTAHHGQTRHGERLGGITLRQDEGTFLRLCRSCLVGIVELGNALDFQFLRPTRLTQFP